MIVGGGVFVGAMLWLLPSFSQLPHPSLPLGPLSECCPLLTVRCPPQVQTAMMGDIHHFAWRAQHANETQYIVPRDRDRFGDWQPLQCNNEECVEVRRWAVRALREVCVRGVFSHNPAAGVPLLPHSTLPPPEPSLLHPWPPPPDAAPRSATPT